MQAVLLVKACSATSTTVVFYDKLFYYTVMTTYNQSERIRECFHDKSLE